MSNDGKTYSLLLKGGHVIDPANGIDGVRDVGIREGKIARVAEAIPASQGEKVVDVGGRYVTPGLLDIHVHVYGYDGWLFPDTHAFPNGVTTVVDTGGAGWKTFEHFKETVIDRCRTRVFAFLNIVGAGMLGPVEQDVEEMKAVPAAEMIRRHPDVLIGSKTAHFQGPGWEAVDGAVEAAALSGTFAMVDFAPKPTRSYRELLLERLRSGDIHTHLYAKHIPLLDEGGKVNGYVREARERGVLFDLGHGAGSFWFRIAIPAVKQGFGPDSISTDLHKSSALIPNATMPVTMSKMLNLGMPFREVILRSTAEPARMIRRPELGTLSVGAEADVAAFRIEEGAFGFVDSGHAKMRGTRRFQCVLTVRAGQIVWDLDGLSWPDWETAGKYDVIR